MSNIVIAFPKQEVAQNVKKILSQSGYSVQAVCTTGAQALNSINNLESGILICGCRFIDMMYTEIYEYLPPEFQKVRSGEDQKVIQKAKELLMERNGFSEEEAHRYIQKRSMDNGTELVEVSQMILSLMQEG